MIKRILPYFRYLRPVWFKFFLGLLFGVLFSLSSGLGLPIMAETVFPLLFGNTDKTPLWLVNISETYFNGELDGKFLLVCCLAIPFTMLFRALGSIGNGYYMSYTGIYVVQAIQIDMFKKVQSLPLAFFKNYKTGEINAAVMGYPTRIKEIVVDTSNSLIKEPLTLIAALGFLAYKSFTNQSFFMAIIGIVSFPIIILLIRRVGNYIAMRAKQLVRMNERLGSWCIECFQSPIEIRAYNLEQRQIKNFVSELYNIFTVRMKSIRFSLLMSPSIEVISAIGIAIALFIGVRSGMGEGEFFALIIALYMAYTPVKKIGAIQNKLKSIEAPLDRLEAVLYAKNDLESPKNSNPVPIPDPMHGEITFKNVQFEYETGKPAIDQINLTINRNESLGIIGKSGAGKSTFVNLILRLYDPTAGTINIDGVDIRKFDIKELRKKISYVPQTPLVFNTSILENIRIGNPEATETEVINAAKQALAHEFIMNTPKGYKTIVSERGTSLSGGQKQKISIARALLKDAPILILDEATSSLDNEADEGISMAIENLSNKRTTIVISHRLSTLKNIDKRVCFKDGEIVAVGSHKDLLKTSKDYQELVNEEYTK